MSDYKTLKGFQVNVVDSDPSNPSLGQIWYHSSQEKLKVQVVGAGAWATSGTLNTARLQGGGDGIQTAALMAGGVGPPDAVEKVVEEYNGSAWSEVGDLIVARRYTAVAGTTSAAVCAGGWNGSTRFTNSEEWNGTGWTEGNNLGTGRYGHGACGTQTAGLIGPGDDPALSDLTEEYDGTDWTAGGTTNTTRYELQICGTQTAAVGSGGSGVSPTVGHTEEYNGTDWTEGNNANYLRAYCQIFGTQTAAVMAGGQTPAATPRNNNPDDIVEEWNGTSWATSTTMNSARSLGMSGGTNTLGLVQGGKVATPGGGQNSGEEWTTAPATQTVTHA